MPPALVVDREVLGPWSLRTSRDFWEGFAPAALSAQHAPEALHTVFLGERDWHRVESVVVQDGGSARISLTGHGDLAAAADQVSRFLSIDIDAREWPDVGRRDPVIAIAQERLPGLRPCGFHSPYEAAAWAVLSQRIRIRQAAVLRSEIVSRYGEDGAFPTPTTLRTLDLELPGRKNEYLAAVAEAALDGILDGAALRSIDAADAIERVQQIKGLGPFAAELVVIRGANAPDVMPTAERRLDAEIAHQYGSDRSAASLSEVWRPFRSWAAVHLRAMREIRARDTGESTMGSMS
ncbi:DNA-3-methyladenine glycosylase [Microbacterium deminutum]|uniref:DNA-3-methyladenine glycosylase II n=2 Tax=Microbacterium deminutum TaxID=344164 RepID=A0ABN2QFQ2_9MICO